MSSKRAQLAARRRTVGYSQERLAELLGVERSTVARWESGDTEPQPCFRPKIADALRISIEDLGALLTAETPDRPTDPVGPAAAVTLVESPPVPPRRAEPVPAARHRRGTVTAPIAPTGGDGQVERRAFLILTGAALTAPAHQWLVREPEPLTAALAGGRVSGALADRLPAMISELRTMDDVAGGGTVLSLAQHGFEWITGLLENASYDTETGRKLHAALGEFGQLSGWVAYDSGQHRLAQKYYLSALQAAHTADDRPLGAHVLGSMAYQAARHGRPDEAVTLIRTAAAGVRGRGTPSLLAALYIRQAYAFAMQRDAIGCADAISKARRNVEKQQVSDDPPWLYWVRPAEIIAGAGDCYLQLGQTERATITLREGISLFDEPFSRDRQIYVTHLADALARPGKQRDLDAAAGHGNEAIDLAVSLDSSRSRGRIGDLRRQLSPHSTIPAVRGFLERATDFLAA